MVAEVVPEESRVEAGALLYTSAPFGLFLATWVNVEVAGDWFQHDPANSWRYVLMFGLLPAAVAFVVRIFVKEPEKWTSAAASAAPARLREIFAPELRPRTISALVVAIIALIAWWSCNAFIPVVATTMAQSAAAERALEVLATTALVEDWKFKATMAFNIGGLVGTLLTVPFAKRFGRRTMYVVYFAGAAASIFATFGLDIPDVTRLYFYFFIGVTIFGIFGSFTFYLPELFPTRLRSTGSGFCYNIGRVIAAVGVFAVGAVASAGRGDPGIVFNVMFLIGFVPVVGLLFMRWVIETRGQKMPD
jgi:MFS family permease